MLSILLLLALRGPAAHAQQFATRVLKDSLFIPWELVYGPDDHIWFTQKNGYVCRMDTAGTHTDTLLHEPRTITIKESGMLGMALHPHFASTPLVYLVWEYKDDSANIYEQVASYRYDAATRKLALSKILLDSIRGYLFHNGCRLLIADDKLFVSIADATDNNAPQNIRSINGKILRINLDGSIPADNPFPGSPVWTWGHRNPQGMVYANALLYSSEHGPDTDDEINIITRGHNYGWPNVRGYCDQPSESAFCADSPVTAPIIAWTPTIAPCGIDYYRHPMFPTLANSLILTTLKDKHLYQLQLDDSYQHVSKASVIPGFDYGRLRDLCISPDGKIFVSTSNSDPGGASHTDKIVMLYNPTYTATGDGLIVYPNPASGTIHLFIPTEASTLSCSLLAIDGRLVHDYELAAAHPTIDIDNFSSGIYLLKVATDKGFIYMTRIVKENK